MRSTRRWLWSWLWGAALSAGAGGAPLVEWDFGVANAPSWTPSLQSPGVRVIGPYVPVELAPWLGKAWPLSLKTAGQSNTNGAQAAGYVLAELPYEDAGAPPPDPETSGFHWSLVVEADPGRALNIDSIRFDYSRVSTVRGYHLYYSVGPTWENPALLDAPEGGVYDAGLGAVVPTVLFHRRTLPLNLGAVQRIEFRWYSRGGRIEFDNIAVLGELAAAAPEFDPPSLAASGIRFSDVASDAMTIRWTPGNGTNRLVVMRAGAGVQAVPADTFGYAADPTFGAGASLGGGHFVVYAGTSDAVRVTGLADGAVYHVAIFEYNGQELTARYKKDFFPTASQRALGDIVDATLTANGVVGAAWAAMPTNIAPNNGGPIFAYGRATKRLNMDGYSLVGATTNERLNLSLLELSPSGQVGNIAFSNPSGPAPSVTIEAGGRVRLQQIQTFSSGSLGQDQSPAGAVTILGGEGIEIAGEIDARQTPVNSRGGNIVLHSETGPVHVGGAIRNTGRLGTVAVSGRSVQLGDVISHHGSATLPGDAVAISASAGPVAIGHVVNYSTDGSGHVTIAATGAGVTAGSIATHANGAAGRGADLKGGQVTIAADGDVTVGAITTTVARGTSTTVRYDNGGDVSITAGQMVRVTGPILTFALNTHQTTSRWSQAGSVHIHAAGGDLLVEGPIDASSGAGAIGRGDLHLSAPSGGITLHSLDVDRLKNIVLIAHPAAGATIQGPLRGLNAFISGKTVSRFSGVSGDVRYNAEDPANAYLGGVTYALAGTEYSLRPIRVASPAIGQFRLEGPQARVRFDAEPGATYRLWYTTNLLAAPVVWLPGPSVSGAGVEEELSDGPGADEFRIYRLAVEY